MKRTPITRRTPLRAVSEQRRAREGQVYRTLASKTPMRKRNKGGAA
ncbi:MAG TPA: hypothetical protein VFS33_10550 [Gemmatimonadales bacterium]|nr:hypothetical protein [Gemmatimonadales bacterium]